jgi:hypothetical protein
MRLRAIVLAAPILLVGGCGVARAARAGPTDDPTACGMVHDGRIELRLELRLAARLAVWHPHADDGPGALVPAFTPEVVGPMRLELLQGLICRGTPPLFATVSIMVMPPEASPSRP